MPRFVPTGFMDTERALIYLASKAHPNRWQFDDMPEEERNVWRGLGNNLNSELVEAHLRVLVPVEKRDNTIDRLCDYGDALMDLRKALYERRITAEFIDEVGKKGHIFSEGWGGDAGYDILLKGTAWLDDGGDMAVCRLVLFNSSDIERLADPSSTKAPGPVETSQPKIAAAKVQRAFDDWRASQSAIPTYVQDVEHMKALGVSRERVRELRKSATTNPRGAPRKLGGK